MQICSRRFLFRKFALCFAAVVLIYSLYAGCHTPEVIVLERERAFPSDAFDAFSRSLQREGSIPLNPDGTPDLKKLGVTLRSPIKASSIYWWRNLSAQDFSSENREFVIGFCASDVDEDFSYHVFLLYSNGMIVSTGTSKQKVDQWASSLRRQIKF
jgi:hypothetical protein